MLRDERIRDVDIRLAMPVDVEHIVEIFRAGFPRALLPYTIYDQPGIVDYLRGMVASQRLGTTSMTAVATYRGQVVAWAQFHRHPTLLFLNHIYVSPDFQGAGVGRLLLRDAIALVKDPGQIYLGSEAFINNHKALRWYKSLGLTPSDRLDWVEIRPVLSRDKPTWWSFDGLITGLASQKRFGFSRFLLRTARAEYVIRSLGRRFYRGNSFDIMDDPSAMTALHTLDPERSLMIITRAEGGEPLYPTVAQGQQVRGRIDVALAVLGHLPI